MALKTAAVSIAGVPTGRRLGTLSTEGIDRYCEMTGSWRKFAVLIPLMLVFTVQAEWSSRLEAGGEVNVDPRTNRATITRDGVTTPAWDGVHQLQDGSTLTIRAGQAVPNQEILRARQQPPPAVTDQASAWVGTPIVGFSPCEQLVRRVCGKNQGCEAEPACKPARQLLDMEEEERSGSPQNMTYSSGQCMEALKDSEFFGQCPQ